VIFRLLPITTQPDFPKILSLAYGGQVQLSKSNDSPGLIVAISPLQPAFPVSPAQATMIEPPGQFVAVNFPDIPTQYGLLPAASTVVVGRSSEIHKIIKAKYFMVV